LLITKLKKHGLFNRYFSDDKSKKEELNNDFRYVISILSENPVYYDLDFLDRLDELRNNGKQMSLLLSVKLQFFLT